MMDVERLGKLAAMMQSPVDGEVLNAARMAYRMLQSERLSWQDVIMRAFREHEAPPPPPPPPPPPQTDRPYGAKASGRTATKDGIRARELVGYLSARKDLTPWEEQFIASLSKQVAAGLTVKQWAVVLDIANKRGIL